MIYKIHVYNNNNLRRMCVSLVFKYYYRNMSSWCRAVSTTVSEHNLFFFSRSSCNLLSRIVRAPSVPYNDCQACTHVKLICTIIDIFFLNVLSAVARERERENLFSILTTCGGHGDIPSTFFAHKSRSLCNFVYIFFPRQLQV